MCMSPRMFSGFKSLMRGGLQLSSAPGFIRRGDFKLATAFATNLAAQVHSAFVETPDPALMPMQRVVFVHCTRVAGYGALLNSTLTAAQASLACCVRHHVLPTPESDAFDLFLIIIIVVFCLVAVAMSAVRWRGPVKQKPL